MRQVEACPFRDEVEGTGRDGAARCRLVARIAGNAGGEGVAVRRSTCDACCAAVEPTTEALNPVTASLLYSLSVKILAKGGAPGCDAGRASELKDWAFANLPGAERFGGRAVADGGPRRPVLPPGWGGRPSGHVGRPPDGPRPGVLLPPPPARRDDPDGLPALPRLRPRAAARGAVHLGRRRDDGAPGDGDSRALPDEFVRGRVGRASALRRAGRRGPARVRACRSPGATGCSVSGPTGFSDWPSWCSATRGPTPT